MDSFSVEENLNTKCPKLGKISLAETLFECYKFVYFGKSPVLVG